MFWYIHLLFSIFTEIIETLLDKKLVLRNKNVDFLIASFYRNLTFFIITFIFGFLRFFGKVSFFITKFIIFLGIVNVINSLIYQHFLVKSEVSRINGIEAIFPILYLFIDNFFFQIKYSYLQIIGFILVIFGSYLMSICIYKKDKKFVFSKKDFIFLSISFLIESFKWSLFKYYSNTLGINSVTFYINCWFIVLISFLVLILYQKKFNILFKVAKKNHFLTKTFISKFFDSLSGLFFLEAIALSTLSKVEILSSFFPVFLVITIFILQKKFKINFKENFSKENLKFKIIGSIFISFGSIFVIF